MSTQTKRTAKVSTTAKLANQAGASTSDQSAVQVKRRGSAGKRKMAWTTTSAKASNPFTRGQVKGEKLRCRYCGSEDLAPSFRKRHDARCRACFKQRYGSGSRDRKHRVQAKSPARAK